VTARLAALLLALAVLPAALAADAPSPRGRAYLNADLAALLEGLGHESRALEGGGRYVRLDRPGYGVDLQVMVSADGASILLYAPLREWPDVLAAPESVLIGLLRRTLELGPSRFYLASSSGGHWVGLLRSIDNRGVLARHVRENIDDLFEHVKATEDLWNPERWPRGAAVPAPAMGN
jgi:hypothetical protein